MTPEWIHEVKRRAFAEVAAAVGVSPRGKNWTPCPNPKCGVERRGKADTRGPVVGGTEGGWSCVVCDAAGDAVDLVSFATVGVRYRDAGPEEKARVETRVEELGLIAGGGRGREAPSRSARPASRVRTARSARPGATTVVVEDQVTESGAFRASWFAWRPEIPSDATRTLWEDPAAAETLSYLRVGRALTDAAIRKWKLGAFRDQGGGWWVSIPLLDARTGDPVNVKFRRVPDAEGATAKPKYMTCPSRPMPLFGTRALPDDEGATIVIVEGELDVVALWDYGWTRGVVSGTTGSGASWPDEWLDDLEVYDHFVIGFDDDPEENEKARAGVEKGREKLISSLGRDRCSIATFPRKDPGQCRVDGVTDDEVDRAIQRATPLVGVELRPVGSYEEEFERLLETPEKLVGLPTWSGKIDAMIGGWPMGLTVLTGHSGAGKTTFGTWSLYEQAIHGVPSGLTSFEQGQSGSLAKLLRIAVGRDFLEVDREERRHAWRKLNALPLDIVHRYGRMTVDELAYTIKRGRRRKGIRVWLVDHLGFLVDSSRDDERRQIDHVVRTLTLLGNDEQVSILLVAHPDKGGQKEKRITIHDLKGSSAIEQDCAVGLVVEKARKSKTPAAIVRADKVRSEWGTGEGSWQMLHYDPQSCTYADEWAMLPSSMHGEAPPEPDDSIKPRRGARSARRPDASNEGPADSTRDDPAEDGESED